MQKTICITGATSGFGKSCALLFGAHGYRLILCGRRLDRLKSLRDQMEGVDLHCLSFDVRSKEQIEQALAGLPDRFAKIDILVNNAGLALGQEPAHKASIEDWETMVDTNIKGLLYMTRQILPLMVKRGTGHVVNIGSVAGSNPYPGGNTYGASKAFVSLFSRNLRADLEGTGVRVTSVEPGLADTEFSLVRFHGDQEKADNVYKGIKPLSGDDIAEAVFWAVNRPEHVNINCIEVMPTCQSYGPYNIYRQEND